MFKMKMVSNKNHSSYIYFNIKEQECSRKHYIFVMTTIISKNVESSKTNCARGSLKD